MKFKNYLIVTFLSSMIVQTSFANNAVPACPSAEQMSNFNYLASFPYGFDQPKKRINLLALAVEPEAATSNINGDWIVLTYPLKARPEDNIPAVMEENFKTLQPYSTIPFQVSLIDDQNIPLCVYTSQGNPKLNILAYFIDNHYYDDDCDMGCDDDFAHVATSKKKHHRLRMMKIAKHVKTLLMN